MAGTLDRRVTLQAVTETQDSFGQPIKTWSDTATVWANKRPLRGDERVANQQLKAVVDTIWRIRHRTDVTPKSRLLEGSRVHDIQAVLELGRSEGLELYTQVRAE